MIKFDILTLFPDMFPPVLQSSILGRALKKGLVDFNCVNIREFSTDKHKKVDDCPYGGGAGMLLQAQPVYDACMSVIGSVRPRVIYTSPRGRLFSQPLALELAGESHVVIICGHYEGVDQRVLDELEVEEISIGGYVLTGGEIAAMAIIDSVVRLIEGVLPERSKMSETFVEGFLEYPQYTRPAVWRNRAVPSVLLNGNHKLINEWKKEQSIQIT